MMRSSLLASGVMHGTVLGFLVLQGSSSSSRGKDAFVIDCVLEGHGAQTSQRAPAQHKKRSGKSTASLRKSTPLPLGGGEAAEEQIIPHPENSQPPYPEPAREQAIEGEVVLVVGINKEGVVESVIPSEPRCYVLLEKAAIDTVKQWRFTVMNPRSSLLRREVSIKFRLGE